MKLPMISLKKWWLKYLISVSLLLTSLQVISQELNCRIRVNADQIQISDRRIFKDMEVAFAQFLNSRKWTNDNYSNEEKINCNLTFTIDQMPSIGVFSSTVQIQSARRVREIRQRTSDEHGIDVRRPGVHSYRLDRGD